MPDLKTFIIEIKKEVFMAEDIKQFNPGDKLTADDTNANNLLLKQWALDNSASEAYINTKMAQLASELGAQITSINTQISSLNSQISSINNSKISATQSSKTASKGYVKFSNGMIIQWGREGGMGKDTSKSVYLPTNVSTTNYTVSGSSNYAQSAGDKRSSWFVTGLNKGSFTLNSRFEQSSNNTIYWTAVGF